MIMMGGALGDLARWFERHNIPTDSLTVILNIADADAAARFDAAFNKEADLIHVHPGGPLDLRQMQIGGVKVRLESPLHTP